MFRTYPQRTVVAWRTPVLVGAFVLAALLLGGGILAARMMRDAMRRAEERVSFVNHVSHDLRTPLTNLLLHADLAMDAIPQEHRGLRRRLGLMREETSRQGPYTRERSCSR